jgi:hypothetical protein
MANAIGMGWAYTTLALIFLAGSAALWVIMRYGLKWRGERKVKEDKADEKKRRIANEKERTRQGQA